MKIKELEIENIRSYKSQKINFEDGVLLFEGDIGSGKSTILYAIEFALFGFGDLKSGFILKNGEKEGRVCLVMDIDGKDIIFRRILERKRNSVSQKECCIIIAGQKYEYSPEEMKREVLKILKFNENPSPKATSCIYRYAVFTPQEEMKEILSLPEDKRIETLRKAFGIEEYKTARSNASGVSKEIKEIEAFLSGSLKDLEALVLEKKEKESELLQLRSALDELSKKREAFEKRLLGIEGQITSERLAKEEFNRLAGEIPRIEALLSDKKRSEKECEKTIALTISEILSKKERLVMLEKETIPLAKSEAEVSKELAETKEKISFLSKEIGSLEKALKDADFFRESANAAQKEIEIMGSKISELLKIEKPSQKTDSELMEEIQKARASAGKLQEKKGVIRDAVLKTEKLVCDSICPLCSQKIDPAHFSGKAEELKKELAVLEQTLSIAAQNESELNKLRERMQQYRFAAEKIAELNSRKEAAQKNREAYSKMISGTDAIISSVSQKHALLKTESLKEAELLKLHDAIKAYRINSARISETKTEIGNLEKRLESEKSRLESIKSEIIACVSDLGLKKKKFEESKSIAERLSALEKELDAAKKSREDILKETSASESKKAALEKECERLSFEISKKEKEKIKKESLFETRMWLDGFFSNALLFIEQHVLSSINEEFNASFQKWFGIIAEAPDITVSINDSFTPLVVQNGYEQDISSLSGGEKTAVAFAYRLALNTVVKKVCSSMNSSGLLILDEPTYGFSKEQLNRLRDVFLELACKQIIIVSHEKELEGFADKIYRVRKESGISKVY